MTFRLKTYLCVTLACIVVTIQAAMASSGAGPMVRSALLRQAIRNQVLTNHVIKSNTKKTWTRCVAACLDEDQCVSINYGGTGGICELNASHKEAHPGDVVDKDGWRYYGTQEKTPAVELQQTITTAAPTTAAPTTAAPTTAAPTTAAPTTAAPTTAATATAVPTTAALTTAAPSTAAPTTAAPTTAAPTTAAPTTAAPTTAALTTAAPTTVADTTITATPEKQPIDCWDIQTKTPSSISGVYTVYPEGRSGSLHVSCDMDRDEGGWTVFQRRVDDAQDFYLTWADYKAGFGDITRNFWLGNDALNELTSQRDYQIRIELQTFTGTSSSTHAKYGRFRVDTEGNKYRLTVGTFYGSYEAGDSFSQTDGQFFSTKDQDNDLDTRHCAQTYLGSWWYKACIFSCLNCPYQNSASVPNPGQGVVWGEWLNGLYNSLKFAEMKIRPVEALQGKDCYDLLMMGKTISGVYDIHVTGRDQPLRVYCEMANSGGGWTVFQRRQDGSQDFYLTWADYKAGFGDLTGEFWLGNDNIHLLTNQRSYQLIVIVQDWNNNVRYANYQEFTVASEADFYRLSVAGYVGNIGDSLTSTHNGMAWSTHDQDNDLDGTRKCAQAARGAWWYNACDNSNLNGPYSYSGSVSTVGQGVIWSTWGSQTYSFPRTEMKIRPAEVGF